MRVYVPVTMSGLRAFVASRRMSPAGGIVFGVTPDLRLEYPEADDEELEYLAMSDAGRASLRLLAAADAAEPALRVVIAVDVEAARPLPDRDRAAALLDGQISWPQVASVHLDGADAAPVVRAPAAVVDLADLDDDDAEFTVGSAEDVALAWYAPGEVAYLIEDLDALG